MNKYERIIANINVSMSMEGMALDEELKEKMLDCLTGKLSYEEAVKQAVEKYQQPE